ncbi:MAG TPA: hypothetical protein PKA17_04040, partial [Phenylobacterium sp.]|nr:hypothetical protein [Phenylobacterium sp.]
VMLGLDGRYLDAAGVDPGAIRAVAGLAGAYDFLPLEGRLTPPIFGAAADLEATQPLAHASRRSPPAFLATGEDDQVVEARNTLALAQALRDQGAVVETALSRPLRGRAPVLDDMVAFLRRQVGLGDQVAMRHDREALP